MEYNIKPSENRDYIILQVVGDFYAKDMMVCIIESHTLGGELGIHRYLVDVREARNIDTSLGNYNFAYFDMKTTDEVDPLAKVAGLINPGDRSHDFVETVSANAGMSLKLFTELSEAEKHLING